IQATAYSPAHNQGLNHTPRQITAPEMDRLKNCHLVGCRGDEFWLECGQKAAWAWRLFLIILLIAVSVRCHPLFLPWRDILSPTSASWREIHSRPGPLGVHCQFHGRFFRVAQYDSA